MSVVSVKDQVDAGINILVTHAGKLWHTYPPLRRIVSDEVITLPRKLISGTQTRIGIGSGKLHPQGLDPAFGTGRS